MILINKSDAPVELEALKQEAEKQNLSDKEAYDLLRNPLKRMVREALVKEQGHLCAYCMRRIPDERISKADIDLSNIYIEHWIARSSKNIDQNNSGLDYYNMLAVCSGNEKAPSATRRKRRFFTCDKKRNSANLKVNPLDKETLKTIYYSTTGIIDSTDEVIKEDLNVRLNLNCDADAVTLPQCRAEVLNTVQKAIIDQGGDILSNCKEQLAIWEGENDPKTPYIGIVIWWLKEQIKEMTRNNQS